ncbi:hypothetical protein E4U43_002269 [Claviceps pusilla]|uniref:MOZ protein represents a chromatin-associated acetyltransferase n=1 Tax=Claviceps pusilla TaxID=123648 RepID=A0A9P7N935_9HYPO|nr:hypothetical protein E4U43_002269 [Claviceps pusilla]
MSTAGRLTFLYPRLLRRTRTCVRCVATKHNTVPITTRWVATTRAKSSFAPRHGKAVEPTWERKRKAAKGKTEAALQEQHRKGTLGEEEAAARRDGEVVLTQQTRQTEAQPGGSDELEQSPPQTHMAGTKSKNNSPSPAPSPDTTPVQAPKTKTTDPQPQSKPPADAHNEESSPPPPPSSSSSSSSLDAGPPTHMPLPDKMQTHPHMTPPPYVHHFDSYSMVKLLEEGGYTRDQAVSSMKAIRTILGGNLEVAQRSLVSKSDVENETYLFHAACSELSTEIKNNRRLQEEQMRQQRTHLQHEVDILTQTLNQELLTLNDSVRGLFNDRNMAVREEQKAVESAIQQINYKMSILLSSDSKSEIEGVRWILIRRSVVGLLFLAVLTLGMIRYTTYLAQQKKKEAERLRKERERLRRDGGRTDNSAAADAAVILSAS